MTIFPQLSDSELIGLQEQIALGFRPVTAISSHHSGVSVEVIDNPSLSEICKLVEEIFEEYANAAQGSIGEGFMSWSEVESNVNRWRARLIKIISEIDYATKD